MILEVYLHNFVAQTEHNRVSGAHPFLDIDNVLNTTRTLLYLIWNLGIRVRLLSTLKVASEVLQKRHFLLKVLRVICKRVFTANILSVRTSTLHVVKVEAIRVKANLSGVIEEDTSCFVAQTVAQTVLRAVINPFLDPDLIITLGQWQTNSIARSFAVAWSRGSVITRGLTATHSVIISYRGCLRRLHAYWLIVAICRWQELANISR